MQIHRILPAALVLLLIPLLPGCRARDSITIHISKEQIQEQLAARFPIEKQELLLKAVFRDPQILLKPGSDRIGVEARTLLQVTPEATITGRVTLEGDFRYEPGSGQFLLKNIRLVDARIDTVSPRIESEIRKIGGLPTVQGIFTEICKLVPPRISDVRVGQLPDDWKGRAAKAVVRSVAVTGDGLDVEVGLPR
jgi:hypothetical protein